jgi:hypothetical protein
LADNFGCTRRACCVCRRGLANKTSYRQLADYSSLDKGCGRGEIASPCPSKPKVSSHYTHGGLIGAIDAALRKAGKDPAALKPEDLAAIDEFHVRGREATAELGRHLGPKSG